MAWTLTRGIFDPADPAAIAERELQEKALEEDAERRREIARAGLREQREAGGSWPQPRVYSDECMYSEHTDRWNRRALRVACPHCQREASPLLSPTCAHVDFYWRWCSLDHQDPCNSYHVRCPGCRQWYGFEVITPQ